MFSGMVPMFIRSLLCTTLPLLSAVCMQLVACSGVEKQLSDIEREIQKYRTELEDRGKEKASLSIELRNAKIKKSRIVQEKSAMLKRLNTLQNIDKAGMSMKETDNSISALKSNIATKDSEIGCIDAEMCVVRSRIAHCNNRITYLRSMIPVAERSRDRLSKK